MTLPYARNPNDHKKPYARNLNDHKKPYARNPNDHKKENNQLDAWDRLDMLGPPGGAGGGGERERRKRKGLDRRWRKAGVRDEEQGRGRKDEEEEGGDKDKRGGGGGRGRGRGEEEEEEQDEERRRMKRRRRSRKRRRRRGRRKKDEGVYGGGGGREAPEGAGAIKIWDGRIQAGSGRRVQRVGGTPPTIPSRRGAPRVPWPGVRTMIPHRGPPRGTPRGLPGTQTRSCLRRRRPRLARILVRYPLVVIVHRHCQRLHVPPQKPRFGWVRNPNELSTPLIPPHTKADCKTSGPTQTVS
jgi:hypothetical protein